MTSYPLISIVMAAFNAERFICVSIQSVLNQTYHNWEMIIVDDRSQDLTLEKIKSFSDPRIRIVELKTNIGAGDARNKGLEIAKGEFIAFLDADDVWLPNKLERQLSFMVSSKAPICHTSYSFINEEGQMISGYVEVSSRVNLDQYMKNTEIGLSTSMINKQLVGNFKFSSMRLRQDTRLWIELLLRNFLAFGLNETLVNYRVRQGQISGNKFKSAWRTLKLYWSIKDLSVRRRMINFCFYMVNGILKRLVPKK